MTITINAILGIWTCVMLTGTVVMMWINR